MARLISDAYARSLMDREAEDNEDSWQATRSLEAGYEGLKGSFNNAAAAVSRAVGAKDTAKSFERDAEVNAYKSAGQRGHVPQWDEVSGIGDGLTYATDAIFSNLPLMAATLPMGGVGGLVGKSLATQAAGKTLAARGAQKAIAEQAAQRYMRMAGTKGAERGAMAGAFVPYSATTTGETYGRIRQDEDATGDEQLQALASIASGGLQGFIGIKALKGVTDSLLRKSKTPLRTIGTTAALEGVTEGMESVTSRATHSLFNPEVNLLDADARHEYIASMLGGAIVGGGISGAGAGVRSLRDLVNRPDAAPRLRTDLPPQPEGAQFASGLAGLTEQFDQLMQDETLTPEDRTAMQAKRDEVEGFATALSSSIEAVLGPRPEDYTAAEWDKQADAIASDISTILQNPEEVRTSDLTDKARSPNVLNKLYNTITGKSWKDSPGTVYDELAAKFSELGSIPPREPTPDPTGPEGLTAAQEMMNELQINNWNEQSEDAEIDPYYSGMREVSDADMDNSSLGMFLPRDGYIPTFHNLPFTPTYMDKMLEHFAATHQDHEYGVVSLLEQLTAEFERGKMDGVIDPQMSLEEYVAEHSKRTLEKIQHKIDSGQTYGDILYPEHLRQFAKPPTEEEAQAQFKILSQFMQESPIAAAEETFSIRSTPVSVGNRSFERGFEYLPVEVSSLFSINGKNSPFTNKPSDSTIPATITSLDDKVRNTNLNLVALTEQWKQKLNRTGNMPEVNAYGELLSDAEQSAFAFAAGMTALMRGDIGGRQLDLRLDTLTGESVIGRSADGPLTVSMARKLSDPIGTLRDQVNQRQQRIDMLSTNENMTAQQIRDLSKMRLQQVRDRASLDAMERGRANKAEAMQQSYGIVDMPEEFAGSRIDSTHEAPTRMEPRLDTNAEELDMRPDQMQYHPMDYLAALEAFEQAEALGASKELRDEYVSAMNAAAQSAFMAKLQDRIDSIDQRISELNSGIEAFRGRNAPERLEGLQRDLFKIENIDQEIAIYREEIRQQKELLKNVDGRSKDGQQLKELIQELSNKFDELISQRYASPKEQKEVLSNIRNQLADLEKSYDTVQQKVIARNRLLQRKEQLMREQFKAQEANTQQERNLADLGRADKIRAELSSIKSRLDSEKKDNPKRINEVKNLTKVIEQIDSDIAALKTGPSANNITSVTERAELTGKRARLAKQVEVKQSFIDEVAKLRARRDKLKAELKVAEKQKEAPKLAPILSEHEKSFTARQEAAKEAVIESKSFIQEQKSRSDTTASVRKEDTVEVVNTKKKPIKPRAILSDNGKYLRNAAEVTKEHKQVGAPTIHTGVSSGVESVLRTIYEKLDSGATRLRNKLRSYGQTDSTVTLTKAQLRRADEALKSAATALDRTLPLDAFRIDSLRAIWHQVRAADEVFVIGKISDPGKVQMEGNPGYAAAMAMQEGKKVTAYSPFEEQWYQSKDGKFVPVDEASVQVSESNIAVVGTSRLSEVENTVSKLTPEQMKEQRQYYRELFDSDTFAKNLKIDPAIKALYTNYKRAREAFNNGRLNFKAMVAAQDYYLNSFIESGARKAFAEAEIASDLSKNQNKQLVAAALEKIVLAHAQLPGLTAIDKKIRAIEESDRYAEEEQQLELDRQILDVARAVDKTKRLLDTVNSRFPPGAYSAEQRLMKVLMISEKLDALKFQLAKLKTERNSRRGVLEAIEPENKGVPILTEEQQDAKTITKRTLGAKMRLARINKAIEKVLDTLQKGMKRIMQKPKYSKEEAEEAYETWSELTELYLDPANNAELASKYGKDKMSSKEWEEKYKKLYNEAFDKAFEHKWKDHTAYRELTPSERAQYEAYLNDLYQQQKRTENFIKFNQTGASATVAKELSNSKEFKRALKIIEQSLKEQAKHTQFAGEKKTIAAKLQGILNALNAEFNTNAKLITSKEEAESILLDLLMNGKEIQVKKIAGRTVDGFTITKSDGSMAIYVSSFAKPENGKQVKIPMPLVVEKLFHEYGHALLNSYRKSINSDAQLRNAMLKDFQAYKDALAASPTTTTKATKFSGYLQGAMELSAEERELSEHERRETEIFDEWFANQISRWGTTATTPTTMIGVFFKSLYNAFRKLVEKYNQLVGKDMGVAPSVEAFIQKIQAVRKEEREHEDAKRAHAERSSVNEAKQKTEPRATVDEANTQQKTEKQLVPSESLLDAINAWMSGNEARMPLSLVDAIHRVLQQRMSMKEYNVLRRAASTAVTKGKILKVFGHNPQVLEDLADSGKAAAYLYAAIRMGYLKGGPETQNAVARTSDRISSLRDAYHQLIGEYTLQEQYDNLIDAIENNKLKEGRREDSFIVPESALQNATYQQVARKLVALVRKLGRIYDKFAAVGVDRVVHDGNPDLIDLVHKFYASVGDSIRGRTETFLEAERTFSALYNARYEEILGDKITDIEFTNRVLEAMSTTAKYDAADTEVKDAVDKLRDLMAEVEKYKAEAGVDISATKTASPVAFDELEVMQNKDQLIELFLKRAHRERFEKMRKQWNKMNPNDSFTDVEKFIQERFDDIVTAEGAMFNPAAPETMFRSPTFGGISRADIQVMLGQAEPADAELLNTFLQKDLGISFMRYIRGSVKQAEYVKRAGRNGEKLTEAFEKARKSGATEEQIRVAEDTINGILGMHGRRTSEAITKWIDELGISDSMKESLRKQFGQERKGQVINSKLQNKMGWVITYQNWRLLIMSAFASFIDPLAIAVRTGDLGMTFKSMAEAKKALWNATDGGQPKQLRELIDALGVLDRGLISEQLHAEFQNNYMSMRAQKLNDVLFKVNQMEALTRFTRAAATSGANMFILKHKRLLEESSDPTNHPSMRYFEELGIQPSDVSAENDIIKLLSWEERKNASPEEIARDNRVRSAMRRMVDSMNVRPDGGKRPIWMNDPHFALIGHLKGYAFAFHEQILKRVWDEMSTYGDLRPLLMLLGPMLAIMVLSDWLRDMIRYGSEGASWKKDWGVLDHATYGLERVGFYGRDEFAWNAFENIMKGEQGRAATEILGPTASHIRQMAQYGISDRELPTQSLWRNW